MIGKGVFQVSKFVGSIDNFVNKEVISSSGSESTCVLDTIRSPSPLSSLSTLAGSGGGGYDHTVLQKWSNLETSPCIGSTAEPLHKGGIEGVSSVVGDEKCGGLNLEDWESMLSDSGDVNDSSFGFKQLLQSGNEGIMRIVDHSLGFDSSFGCVSSTDIGSMASAIVVPPIGFSTPGFSSNISNDSRTTNGKFDSITQNNSGAVNHKVSNFGMNSNGCNTTDCSIQNPRMCSSSANNLVPLPVSLPAGVMFQQQFGTLEETPQTSNSQKEMTNQQYQSHNPSSTSMIPAYVNQQDPSFHLLQPQAKRHNSGGIDPSSQILKVPFADMGHEFLVRKHEHQLIFPPNHLQQFLPHQLHDVHQKPPLVVPKQKVMAPIDESGQNQHNQQELVVLDQLFQAAEMLGTGNFPHAQLILARLNHQLSPVGKALQRAAFYFKEALQMILMKNSNNDPVTSLHPRRPTPYDVIYKMGSYKVFSEICPLIQFANFTCNQVLLEALDNADRIHVIDFDIGFGAQWASFMQELSVRSRGAPSFKITAFASPSTLHPLELELLRENLTLFAEEIGIAFDLEVVNIDSFDPNSYSMPTFQSNVNEAIAVNFPVWSSSNHPNRLPSLLHFIKKLSPRIIVSLDQGCDQIDLPLSQHLFHALQSHTNLLESLDAVNVALDVVDKIEKFLLQPKIENTVMGRLRASEKMPLFQTLIAAAGFVSVQFSNFTEIQADCVVKRMPSRGFHVEKRQATLVLCWQCRDLISASAWRC